MIDVDPPALLLVGDLHDDPTPLITADLSYPAGVPFLQVGDLTWTRHRVADWIAIAASLRRVLYFLRGNHDDPTLLGDALRASEPVTLAPQLVFIPDGVALTLGGLRIGCIGGATSLDRRDREPYGLWWRDEVPSDAAWSRAVTMGPVDLLVTHCPPASVVDAIADARMPRLFGLPPAWRDPVATLVEHLRDTLGRPPLVAGHMHRPYVSVESRVRLLGLDDVVPWPSAEPPSPPAT
jgi:hypothetical protein